MRDTLQVGDEVITIGGFIGKIMSVKGDTLVISIGVPANALITRHLAVLHTDAVGALLPARIVEELLGRLGVVAPVPGVVLVALLDGEEEAVAQQQLVMQS